MTSWPGSPYTGGEIKDQMDVGRGDGLRRRLWLNSLTVMNMVGWTSLFSHGSLAARLGRTPQAATTSHHNAGSLSLRCLWWRVSAPLQGPCQWRRAEVLGGAGDLSFPEGDRRQ